jgi:hypothetical protein
MKMILRSFASLMLLGLWVASPARADDTTGDSKPGFFHRLGDAIFHGTHKLEKSDTVDASGGPVADDETTQKSPAPSAKKAAATKKLVPNVAPKPVTEAKDDDTSSAKDASNTKTEAETDDAKSKLVTDKSDVSNSAPQGKDYPLATRATKAGFIKSPFPPHHERDATGRNSGSLARDPTNGKVFRVP